MDGTSIRLCAIASGSAGNLSALLVETPSSSDVFLIDAGIPPRRAFADFRLVGIDPALIRGVLVTHLDRDHWHPGWIHKLPEGAFIAMHERHARSGRRAGLVPSSVTAIHGPFPLREHATATSISLSHDEHGVSAFRLDFAHASLGFATDLGRVTDDLVDLFTGVDVLAIESNYCRRLQAASRRPDYLKRRIMGGSGHLSNDECARAVERIAPRKHVVFLHLSRECNDPALVRALHEGADYEFTIASQDRPSRWVRIEGDPARPARAAPAQASLFAPAP